MRLRVACLLLMLAAVEHAEGLTLYWDIYKNDDAYCGPLQLVGYFHDPRPGHVVEVKLYESQPGEEETSHLFIRVDSTGTSKVQEGDKFDVTATLKDTRGDVSLKMKWKSRDDGFCRFYRIQVTYVDASGNEQVEDQTLEVKSPQDIGCVREGELSYCVKIPEEIKLAFPNGTLEQWQEVQSKMESIDRNTYDVSGIYSGRVYASSSRDRHFQLHKMNELCKNAAPGGYLVELDSPEEQYFVRDYLKSIGSYDFFTGANDVDTEWKFEFYNSKKPMTNVVWNHGEPNDEGGVERCVEIGIHGLNDNQCSRQKGYICEIPLL